MRADVLLGFFLIIVGIMLVFYGISSYKQGINILSPNLETGQKGLFLIILSFVVVVVGLFILKVMLNRNLS